MPEMNSIHILQSFRKRWILHAVLYDFLVVLGIAFLSDILANKFLNFPLWCTVIIFIPVFVLLILFHASWKTTDIAIAQLLNQTYPQLQESSELLLKPYTSLNLLEQLQYKKTEEVLGTMPVPVLINKKRNNGLLYFAVMVVFGFFIWYFPIHLKQLPVDTFASKKTKTLQTEKILPQVKQVEVIIQPPLYTGRNKRTQDKFNLTIEEGTVVQWQLNTTLPVKSVKFIFNDSITVSLKPVDKMSQTWRIDRSFLNAGFYQVNIDGNISELYKIETIKDLAPVIHLQSPKQYTTIDYGEPQKVLIKANLTDDYGISDASITATIASGSGEAVKFKEQKLSLPGFIAGKQQYQLQKILLLNELGMHPGDELYFYIKATDNHQQETRSDIFIVNLPDTAQLMSLDGLANSVNFKPEYFRSERQIIIETEQLLKDKDTISVETFKNKSNNLGIDQKLLRLRYGKFLGDEDENAETQSAAQDELKDLTNFSDANKIGLAFTDKHDNSEDATYFEPALKKQLKETLTEMWNAEIQLRTFKPQDALLFEYKALRLLKDLQQKSRAYVAKASFKTTPLDLKKRLTGDVDKIIQPQFKNDFKEDDAAQQSLRSSLALLEELKLAGNGKKISPKSFNNTIIRLNEKGVQEPSIFLPAVQAAKRISEALSKGAPVRLQDILLTENGLQRLLTTPTQFPSAETNHSKQALSKQYFINLQHKQ